METTRGTAGETVSNKDVLDDYESSVEFVLAYWMHARDSAARRVGLIKKQAPAGADVANLP